MAPAELAPTAVPGEVLSGFIPGMMVDSAPFLQHSPFVNLAVAGTGVNVPPVIVSRAVPPPVQLVVPPVPLAVPAVIPPPPYVPPVFPPRRDRN